MPNCASGPTVRHHQEADEGEAGQRDLEHDHDPIDED